jgi:hypothetical protein
MWNHNQISNGQHLINDFFVSNYYFFKLSQKEHIQQIVDQILIIIYTSS